MHFIISYILCKYPCQVTHIRIGMFGLVVLPRTITCLRHHLLGQLRGGGSSNSLIVGLEGPTDFSSIQRFPETLPEKELFVSIVLPLCCSFWGSSQWEQWSVLNLIPNPQHT
jgi:hypothetical protein